MRNLKDRVVMITGASSGIGKSCALAFADEGCDLVICARRQKELDEVAEQIRKKGRRALAVAVDVTDEKQVKDLAEKAFAEFGKVDIAMSNAGISLPGQTHKLEKADWEKVMNVNFYGCVHVVRYFVPPMVERKEGHLIVNGSGWGLMGGPYNALYATSKHALTGLTESLRAEVAQYNVGVTTLAAGVIKTEIFEKTEIKDFKEDAMEFMDNFKAMSPDKFAKKVVRSVKWNRGLVVITLVSKFTWYFKRLFPRTFEKSLAMFAKFSTKFLKEDA